MMLTVLGQSSTGGMSAARIFSGMVCSPTFPKPIVELSAGKVWETADVEKWIVERRASRRRASDVGHTGSR